MMRKVCANFHLFFVFFNKRKIFVTYTSTWVKAPAAINAFISAKKKKKILNVGHLHVLFFIIKNKSPSFPLGEEEALRLSYFLCIIFIAKSKQYPDIPIQSSALTKKILPFAINNL